MVSPLGWPIHENRFRRYNSGAMLGDAGKAFFADCEIDAGRFELRRDGNLVEISPKTLDLIVLLIERQGQLVTRDELFGALWPGATVNEGSLSNAVYEARCGLGDDAHRQAIIQTVRGRGFRFVAEVQFSSEENPKQEKLETQGPIRAIEPSPSGRAFALSLLALGLGPNAVLGYVNWLYNKTQSIPDWMRPDFDFLVNLYNPISFSIGAIWILLLARKPMRAMRAAQRGEGRAPLAARQRSLVLGHGAACIGIALWVAAAVIYPSALQALTGGVKAEGTLHFLGSLVLCGLSAAAYPFFLITYFSVRFVYPVLSTTAEDLREDRATLLRLRDLAGAYLLAAGGVPMLSIALLALAGSGERWLLAMVSAVGVVGLGASFLMYRRLLAELDALAPSPSRDHVPAIPSG